MALDMVIEWVTDANACYLFGAGCSCCADKPTMGKLTEDVRASLCDNGKKLLKDLGGRACRGATVEDLMDYLIRLDRLLSSRKKKAMDKWTRKGIEAELQTIKRAIVTSIGTEWSASETHKQFFRRLAGHTERRCCDIFSLNYDLVIEATLEAFQAPYVDGFRGSENAYFDETVFETDAANAPVTRLHKLHGSINWTRDARQARRGCSHGLRRLRHPP